MTLSHQENFAEAAGELTAGDEGKRGTSVNDTRGRGQDRLGVMASAVRNGLIDADISRGGGCGGERTK